MKFLAIVLAVAVVSAACVSADDSEKPSKVPKTTKAAVKSDKTKTEKRGIHDLGYGYAGSDISDHLATYGYGSASGYGYGSGYSAGYSSGYDALSHHQPIKTIEITKHVPYGIPHPVPVTVEKHVPYYVKVPVHVPVDRPYEVAVPKPYPVHVDRPVPVPVAKPVPYAVKVPVKVGVPVPQPYEVPKPYAVPVEIPKPYKVDVPYYVKAHDHHDEHLSLGHALSSYDLSGYSHYDSHSHY